MMIKQLLTLFFLTISAPGFSTEYFVSLTGVDEGAGTKNAPFKTLSKASGMAQPGDTVSIFGGVYFLYQPFSPSRSGLPDKFIVYRAVEKDNVIFDGSFIKNVLVKSDSVNFSRQTMGIFQIAHCSYLRFQNIQVANSDAAGFIVRGPETKKIEPIGCTATQTHNSGIGLWYCDSVSVLNCVVTKANDNNARYYAAGKKIPVEAPHEAISICGATFFEVAYNEVYDCFKEGIDCKEVSKHGIIHHNIVHGLPRQAYYCDAWFGLLEDVEFYNNTAYNCMWGFGISVEGKQSTLQNVRFHHNLVYNMQASGVLFGLWGGDGLRTDIYIYNNTFYRCGSSNIFSGGVGSIGILSKNFKDVFIYNNICDKGWDYEMGFTFSKQQIKQALKDRNFIAVNNLFESAKNRPSRKGQYNVMVEEYLPEGNTMGAPLYRNENAFDFVPEQIASVKENGTIFKYLPSPWFGALQPVVQ